MRTTFWLTGRELFSVKRKFLGQVALVAAGVVIFTTTDFISRSRESSVNRQLEYLGPQLRILPKQTFYQGNNHIDKWGSFISEDIRSEIKIMIARRNGLSRASLTLKTPMDGANGTVTGLEPDAGGLVSLEDLDAAQAVVGKGLAEKLRKGEGDSISILGRRWRIERILPELGTNEDYISFVRLDSLQRAAGLGGKVNEIRVNGVNRSNKTGLFETLDVRFPQLQVLKTESRDSDAEQETGATLSQHRSLVYKLMFFVIGLSLMAAAYINVGERKQEMATLRAIGGSSFTVFSAVALRCLIIGFIGGILGLSLGISIGILQDTVAAMRMVWPWSQFLATIAVTMTVSLVASLPASLIASLQNYVVILNE